MKTKEQLSYELYATNQLINGLLTSLKVLTKEITEAEEEKEHLERLIRTKEFH
jgi:hypothetical protein